jgi:predicted peroxiredoxin
MRKTSGFTLLDHKRKEEILKILKVEPVSKFYRNCCASWKFMRKTSGFTLLDHKRNEEILKILKVEPVSKFNRNCCASWKDHIEGMNSIRIPNKLLHYRQHFMCLGHAVSTA